MPLFNRVTIVGLGLIGGSLGMAIRRRRLASTVVGWSRKPTTLRRAKRCGAIDVGTIDLARAVRHADLVVIATPVDAIIPLAKRLSRQMTPGSVLTDVGSVKGDIVRRLERAMPRSVAFIGAHPLAGSEQRGITAACRELFDGSTCILTRTPQTNRHALRVVTHLWKSLVRRVVIMSPTSHDQLLGAVSHVPHVLAYGLVLATDTKALAIAPRSFLDATRVAQSDPELWDDILIDNRVGVSAAMMRFDQKWSELRRAILRGSRKDLRRLLAHAQTKRHALER